MDNISLFRKAASALEEGRPVALVTVISTLGSTPGKVGYKMLVFGAGEEIAGTVGGGLLEAKMITEAARMLDKPGVRRFQFNLDGTAEDEKGICGGSVEFLIETFDRTALPLFRDLSVAGQGGEGGVLLSILSPDGPPRKIRLRDPEQTNSAGLSFPAGIREILREVAASGEAGTKVSAGATDVFLESLAVRPAVVLFGAGHVSYHIARFAHATHFRVIVCDERAEYANRERFPDAEEVLVEDFRQVFDRVRIDNHSYLVIVTRGHKCDQTVLEQAVRTEARYVGMIGSRRKTLTLLQKLRDQGVSPERLDRVYSPIGLSIGAVTAEEIALSIVCEMIKVRRLGDEPAIGHMSLSKGDASR